MNNTALPYWLALMVLLAASYGGWKWWQVQQFQSSRQGGGIVFEGPPLQEFELTERSGKPFLSADMLGRVWVTTFFFATCPGTCPRVNANIRYLNSLEELKDVVWVSITVDPETDTLPKLREYADQFSADPERWLFCRGEFNYTRRVAHDIMKVDISWRGHKDYAVVIDKQGKFRGAFDVYRLSELEKLRALLLNLLEEDPSAPAQKAEEPQQELSAA